MIVGGVASASAGRDTGILLGTPSRSRCQGVVMPTGIVILLGSTVAIGAWCLWHHSSCWAVRSIGADGNGEILLGSGESWTWWCQDILLGTESTVDIGPAGWHSLVLIILWGNLDE